MPDRPARRRCPRSVRVRDVARSASCRSSGRTRPRPRARRRAATVVRWKWFMVSVLPGSVAAITVCRQSSSGFSSGFVESRRNWTFIAQSPAVTNISVAWYDADFRAVREARRHDRVPVGVRREDPALPVRDRLVRLLVAHRDRVVDLLAARAAARRRGEMRNSKSSVHARMSVAAAGPQAPHAAARTSARATRRGPSPQRASTLRLPARHDW